MIYTILCMICWLIGYQIYNKDFLLLTGRYNYRIGLPQIVSYASLIMLIFACWFDKTELSVQLSISLIAFVWVFISEYILSRINSSSISVNIGLRFATALIFAAVLNIADYACFMPFFVMGWYIRNSKFGVPYRNIFVLAKLLRHRSSAYNNIKEVEVEIPEGIPDFSHAGNRQNFPVGLPKYNVTEFGILPNTTEDIIDKVQSLIEEVGQKGGGTIYFPKGKYLFNKKGKKQFLQINHSNVCIEGELDANGFPLTELVNCGSTVLGSKNPWLSPFFITTGEKIQESNIFFGLQFRKKKDIVMRSGSMSDPGSDGTILTPEYITNVIKTSKKGEDVIYVDDTSKIGKYIMLGLYNTDKEASLLKDILGQDVIRPEWQAASRAGEEEAPSFQWLVEVKDIIDGHTIRLVQPLWRDCDICYEPAVFNVLMLENITIKNLKLSSTWNGMFRHHGHKRYYNVAQAQDMDYGWNGINMKRVAHGNIENVVFKNFTNPLYVMDSRNVSCEHLVIKGHDGHQGIKIYEHACDNLFRHIIFYNHYADMMGGEGNAYGNVFAEVKYLNPCFKPVDFDFHGFSEGPMSPPSYNLFENVYGFSHINSSGSLHMTPSCARNNVWWNCICEGEKKGFLLFQQKYRTQLTTRNKVKILLNTLKVIKAKRAFTFDAIKKSYNEEHSKKISKEIMSYAEISKFYTDFYLYGMITKGILNPIDENRVHYKYVNQLCSIRYLYNYQIENK